MATQTVEFRAASGLALTVRLFAVGSDTIVQTASSCTEATNRKGTYAAVFTDPGAAEFELVAFSGGVPVCRWFCTLTLTTATFQAYEVRTQSVVNRVTANTDQWGGVAVTGMPLPTASYTAPLSAASTASAVWDALFASYTVSGSFGARVVRTDAASSGNQLKITASGHAAAVLHDCEAASIPETAFVSGAVSARALATDAAAEVATSVRTELAVELGRIDATVSSRAAASDMSALLSRLGAFTGSGVNTVLGLLKAIMSKAASTPSDVGGTFSATTDSIEAIRDAMQAGTGDASQATLVQVQGTVDAIAASMSGTAINVVSRVADGGDITLYAGDDMRVRSGTQISVTITDVGGAIYTRLNSIGVAQLVFGAARPSQPAGAITGTIASLTQSGSGSSQTLTINIEIEDGGERLAPADNYVWQIVSSDAQGTEYDTYTEVEGTLTLKRRVAVPLYG